MGSVGQFRLSGLVFGLSLLSSGFKYPSEERKKIGIARKRRFSHVNEYVQCKSVKVIRRAHVLNAKHIPETTLGIILQLAESPSAPSYPSDPSHPKDSIRKLGPLSRPICL